MRQETQFHLQPDPRRVLQAGGSGVSGAADAPVGAGCGGSGAGVGAGRRGRVESVDEQAVWGVEAHPGGQDQSAGLRGRLSPKRGWWKVARERDLCASCAPTLALVQG